eukprot:jgi/Psemu1/303400/fgenesh1_kg.103_\
MDAGALDELDLDGMFAADGDMLFADMDMELDGTMADIISNDVEPLAPMNPPLVEKDQPSSVNNPTPTPTPMTMTQLGNDALKLNEEMKEFYKTKRTGGPRTKRTNPMLENSPTAPTTTTTTTTSKSTKATASTTTKRRKTKRKSRAPAAYGDEDGSVPVSVAGTDDSSSQQQQQQGLLPPPKKKRKSTKAKKADATSTTTTTTKRSKKISGTQSSSSSSSLLRASPGSAGAGSGAGSSASGL